MHFFFQRTSLGRSIFTLVFFALAISGAPTQDDISADAKKKLAANAIQEQEGARSLETGLLKPEADQAKSVAEMRDLWIKVKAGDPEAQYALGIKALRGQGFPKSTRTGMYLLGQAADRNHPEALFELFLNYSSSVGLPIDRKETRTLLEGKLDKFPGFVKSPKLTPYEKAVLLDWCVKTCKRWAHDEDRKIVFDKLREPFAKEFPDSSILQYVDGNFYVEYAWDARTGKWAHEVTEEQFREFGRLLILAKRTLEKSYEMDNKNFLAAGKMITVMMGLSRPRREMEKWFDRAIAANPKYLRPYSAKMTYLEPKWLGSAEAMLEFGHECVKKGQWKTNIPFQLISAHERLSNYGKKVGAFGAEPPEQAGAIQRYPYFEREGVWEDIKLVCGGYLKEDPGNHWMRSTLVRYACMCGKWSDAKEQFAILGPNINQDVFSDPFEYEAYYKELTKR